MGSSSSRETVPRVEISSPRPIISSSSDITSCKEEGGDDEVDVSFCPEKLRTTYTDGVLGAEEEKRRMSGEATLELQRHLTKKHVIVPHLNMFQMVDLHARNTPLEMAMTSDRLVTYLMSSCTNSLNTVRIFYTWISLNIRCDIFQSHHLVTAGFDPEIVLKAKMASPVGMNLLFYNFCRMVNIPCSLIHGVLKMGRNVSSCPVRPKVKPNHAWVLLLVQGQWRFVDCACGSGFGEEVKDETVTREFFFLTDPEDLINSHFPLGLTNEVDFRGQPETVELTETLQMLREPISLEQFYRNATVSVLGMAIGLELMSHMEYHVTFEKAEQFSFRSTDITDLACVLTDKTDGSDCPHSVLCTRTTTSEFRAVIKPPRTGTYGLSVYAKLDISSGWPESFHRVVEYSLLVQEVERNFAPFPEHFGVWGANLQAVLFGFSRRIFKFDVLSCRTGDLYVKLPVSRFSRVKAIISPATSDAIGFEDTLDGRSVLSTMTMQTEGVVHLRARFSDAGFYTLSLLSQNRDANQDVSTSFTNVADFVVNCRRQTLCNSPLPKTFPMSQHFRCLLEEPLQRNLVVNRSYDFRLVSPFLKTVKVDGESMQIGSRRKRPTSSAYNDDDDDQGDDDNDDERKGDEDNDRGVVWVLTFTPKKVGSSVYVYGCGNHTDHIGGRRRSAALSALFVFGVVAADEESV